MRLELNQIIEGDCINILNRLPEKCVDLVFADPPYNLQLAQELYRPNQTKVDAVDDEWDAFSSFDEYDSFTEKWLLGCRRVLKDTGAIWVIGSYHNIFRVGRIMMDLGFWILNDVIWLKTNPMPNFRGVRFTNAHETLIWAKKSKNQKKYTFNHHTMKSLNDDKQMRSDWEIALCTGSERCMVNGKKGHSTQKPEALLYRVISATTKPGDVVLDPFFGSGTTGVVAKKLKRNWIGIEKNHSYVKMANKRIAAVHESLFDKDIYASTSRRSVRGIPFGSLVESQILKVGEKLCSSDRKFEAVINADGTIRCDGFRGSIHKVAAHVKGTTAYDGWLFWYYEKNGHLRLIDTLRGQKSGC